MQCYYYTFGYAICYILESHFSNSLVDLPLCLCVYPPVCLFVSLTVSFFIHLCVSICQSDWSIHVCIMYICLPLCLYICLFDCLLAQICTSGCLHIGTHLCKSAYIRRYNILLILCLLNII